MYENGTYIGMVIEIEIQLAITFQLFFTPKWQRNLKSRGMEQEKRFKMM